MMEINWYSDFKWCIDNDFQVYIKMLNNSGQCNIAIRKGGISTDGKSSIYSSVTLGSVTYKNQKQATENLPKVYKYLRETYG